MRSRKASQGGQPPSLEGGAPLAPLGFYRPQASAAQEVSWADGSGRGASITIQTSLTFKAFRGLTPNSDPDCTSLYPVGPVCSLSTLTFLSAAAGPLLLAIPLPGTLSLMGARRASRGSARAGKRSSLNLPDSPVTSLTPHPGRFLCPGCPPSSPRKLLFTL